MWSNAYTMDVPYLMILKNFERICEDKMKPKGSVA
jgi:hypothetical protein